VHEWYLAMFVDAVEWVEMPNVIGMSQFADGGLMASKPYIASGQYIHKMSGYCAQCRFNPALAVGERACPFTTLYWVFIDRHQAWLSTHPRLAMQVKHWQNKGEATQTAIRQQAQVLVERLA
jgi:deoxyribodipyrimidine photolyase-related protein